MSPDRPGSAAGNSAATGLTQGHTTMLERRDAARKIWRVGRALLTGPKTSRELELAPVFDHCAHSTASELRKKGIGIDTEMIEVAGYNGLPARVARYSLTDAGRERLQRLLEAM